ncbi:hypothetical protein L916_01109 [Phytophthora nicotianae]|uniref:Uncharacterized protein n=1 Tax=Phytophthora nicotianae TaxID=4792 RepID=W2JSL1_PHYNI|nr:hypothetical protein L916_01109 [Phytophthora nicotianae]
MSGQCSSHPRMPKGPWPMGKRVHSSINTEGRNPQSTSILVQGAPPNPPG